VTSCLQRRSYRAEARGSRFFGQRLFALRTKHTIVDVTSEISLTVEPYLNGVRIDSFLLRHLRNYTNFRIQRMIRTGNVWMAGAEISLSQRVFVGQTVQVRLAEPPDKLYEAQPLAIPIVFEDPWILVVEKFAGMVAHPVGPHQSGTLCNALQWYLDQESLRRGLLRAGIVHRLDRMTSGLMVIAKDHLSHRHLSLDFQNERVSKSYLAIVEGQPPGSGVITLPIGRAAGTASILMTTRTDAINPRPARTDYEVLHRAESVSVVKARPFTGRNHQIRVHLAAIGHPVVGDAYYEAKGVVRPKRHDAVGFPSRHALHAHTLRFAHPITQVSMEFESQMPDDMCRLIRGSFQVPAGEAPAEP
jgi:23S rRNA pseudouridine1911/1915/1917 synthase